MAFKIFIIWLFILMGHPQDLLLSLQALRPALVLAIVTLLSMFFTTNKTQINSMFQTPEAKRYILFYLIMIIGIPFAYHRRVAFDYIFLTYSMNILFFFVFILFVDSLQKLKTVIFALVCVSTFYIAFGHIEGYFSNGRLFMQGSMFDSNGLAYVLVSLFPLSLLYIARPESLVKKALAWGVMGAALMVILYTGSRAGFLGLITVAGLIFFTNASKIRTHYKIGLLVSLLVISFVYIDKFDIARYLSLTDIGSDYNVTSETGRLGIWKRAYELLVTHPLTGVGVDCFPMALGDLRHNLGIIPRWQAAHNSYMLVAVETGIIGFFIFISLIVGCFRNLSTCRRITLSSPDSGELSTIAGLFQMAFIGQLICAFFLSQSYSMFFTLFFAVSASLRRIRNSVPLEQNTSAVNNPFVVTQNYSGVSYEKLH